MAQDPKACIYYTSPQYFDFETTRTFLARSGYYIGHPKTGIITILNINASFEVNYQHLEKLLDNNNTFSVELWLNEVDYILWAFVFENCDRNCFYLMFYLDYLEDFQIKEASETLIKFVLKEMKRVKENLIGFFCDRNGFISNWYDFDLFFFHQEVLNHIPDLVIASSNIFSKLVLNGEPQIIRLDNDFIAIVTKKDMSFFLTSLL